MTFLTVTTAACSIQAAVAAIPSDPDIEAAVESILSKMSLDEKIGQMTELSIDVLGDWKDGEFFLDPQKLHEAIAVYKVGSVLNAPGGPTAQTPAKWEKLIGQIQEVSMKEIGIPCIYGLDQNHGTTYTLGGVLFPQNINVGASFNPTLARRAAEITAYETRAANCPWTYSPTVDLTRDPRWSRVWENYGEDPLVNAIMGVQQVKGFQGDNPNKIGRHNIATSVKHYLGYGAPRTGKDRTPAYISPSDLREKFFEPYRACIEAGALTVMVNSGSINGRPVHANNELLTKWLKEDLNWDGMIVTDWADINNLYTREYVAHDKKEAIEMAINAGIDMSMEPYDLNFCTLLKELVNEGRVSQERIDDAARRVLRLKYRLGLFDTPNTYPKDYADFACDRHEQVALQAAEESEILLKNNGGILPLKKGTKILLTGPNANSMRCLNGGWSYSWQGHLTDRFASKYNTIYKALVNKFGKKNIVLEQGVTYPAEGAYHEENEPEIEKAVAAASDVDVIVACIGENSYCETPGNLSDLAVSENQRNLVKALAATGKPIILILNGGRPRIISDIEPLADGIVNILLPGNFGGEALANILAGDTNPSGKMPYTYPRHQAELTTYDYRVSEEMDKMEGAYDYDAVVSVQWPFGYGLSYTTFKYDNLRCSHSEFGVNDNLIFTIDVTNTGNCTGKEVVMLFSRDMVASLTPDNRRLRAFEKVELKPGETKTVTLPIKASDLAFVDYDGKWVLEKGKFRMQAGTSVMDIACNDTYKWTTPNK
ncbi:glycoside hydrolase family 3 N-terminal domain-containing protein [Muribaculum intestinale]|uniref:beta-glucosidase n=27 Tax=Muribaculaceae TaxID=2005473 RepID=A0A1B1S6S6_9BACT|nr:glycoside hydrolase family 3 N-terminal domain-containing protein [Muribaculum intestinale]ROT10376.1 beta-glucosidase [Muribaculaceae bacterium Isolate-100 (HZI)]RXE66236.1 beta-glucosidase [Muribaculaceae bacterium Isolate-007 (NCI)]ANU62500.2 beta-glucosidase [Muribaculum intestinale]ASB39022.1 beta-glucosidase [Muribaculum intestinale]PWB00568.1 beta-glucosidase [Muribaculum intestinale]